MSRFSYNDFKTYLVLDTYLTGGVDRSYVQKEISIGINIPNWLNLIISLIFTSVLVGEWIQDLEKNMNRHAGMFSTFSWICCNI